MHYTASTHTCVSTMQTAIVPGEVAWLYQAKLSCLPTLASSCDDVLQYFTLCHASDLCLLEVFVALHQFAIQICAAAALAALAMAMGELSTMVANPPKTDEVHMVCCSRVSSQESSERLD